MNRKHKFERELRIRSQLANLIGAITIESFVLVMGTILITERRSGGELLFATLVVALQAGCAYMAHYRFALAAYLVAIPNLIAAALMALLLTIKPDLVEEPLYMLWMISSGIIGVTMVVIVAWASATESRVVKDA